MAHFTESDEMQFTNTLLAAMKDSEFAGIDFSPLPTAQAGMDEVFIKILSKTNQTERKRLYALLLDSITCAGTVAYGIDALARPLGCSWP